MILPRRNDFFIVIAPYLPAPPVAGPACPPAAQRAGRTGSQAVVVYPNGEAAPDKFWLDTLAVTSYSWPKAVKATVGGGNDSVAMLSLFTGGWPYWKMQIEDADGSNGDEAGDVSVWWKRK